MTSTRFWCLPAVLVAAAALVAQTYPPASPYAGARLPQWSALYLAGNDAGVAAAAQADLLSSQPHPYAAFVWARAHLALADLPAAIAAAPPALQRALGAMPQIELLYSRQRPQDLLDQYPPARAASLHHYWALIRLAQAANQRARLGLEIQYLRLACAAPGADFLALWYLESDTVALADRAPIRALYAPGGPLAATPGGRFLEAMEALHPSFALDGRTDLLAAERMDELSAVAAWLKLHPDDVSALRFQSVTLDELDRRAEAAALVPRQEQLFPFYFSVGYLARIQIDASLDDAARATVAARTRGEWPHAAAAAATARLAFAYDQAGRRGQARNLLQPLLAAVPGPFVNAAMAQLELDSNRPAAALPYARASAAAVAWPYDASTTPAAVEIRLLRALAATGQGEPAWTEYQRAAAALPAAGFDLYHEGEDILDGLGRHAQALALLQQAAAQLPDERAIPDDQAWELAALGRSAEAAAQMQSLLQRFLPASWEIDELARTLNASGQQARIPATFAALCQRYPWVAGLWARVYAAAPDAPAHLAAVHAAIAANPGRAWPWWDLVTADDDAGQWTQAQAAVGQADLALRPASDGDRTELLMYHAGVVAAHAATAPLPSAALQPALAALEQFHNQGGDAWQYDTWKIELLNDLGSAHDAAATDVALAALRHDCNQINGLFNVYSDSVLPTAKKFWLLKSDCVDDDPYDGGRLLKMAERQVQWGGSPIVGLYYLQLLKQRDPALYAQSGADSPVELEAKARGALGDGGTEYRGYLADNHGIAPSERYVGWFDAIRADAQRPWNQLQWPYCAPAGGGAPPACDFFTAQITHPDGQVELRRDNPITGRRERIQVGAAWLQFRYDAEGQNLVELASSGGDDIALGPYDPQGRILGLATHGRHVQFHYNAAGHPDRIEEPGAGAITVTYAPDGSMASVSGSHAVAADVQSVFVPLQQLIAAIPQSEYARLPELPFHDAAADQLRAAAVACGNQPGCAAARLAFGQYLLNHLGDRQAYETEARQQAEAAFAAAAAPGATASSAQAVAAAGLWYALAVKTRTQGLATAEWRTWSAMQSWLAAQTTPPALELRLRIANAPLQLLPSARWLPHSYISSPGYWRRYPLQALGLGADAAAIPDVILARANGEVVVGGSSGLAVLRQGHWERFAFDPAPPAPHWSSTASLASASPAPASAVLALAEDARGTLWIGAANGLSAVAGHYQAPARTVAALQGQRIEHLAVAGDALMVATPAGLDVLRNGQLAPVAGFAGSVRFLHAFAAADGAASVALAGGDAGVYLIQNDAARQLDPQPTRDAVWLPSQQRLYILRNDNSLLAAAWNGAGPVALQPLPDQNNVQRSQQIFGLASLPAATTPALAVLTDQGLSLFRDGHFESLRLPLAARALEARALANGPRAAYVLTNGGVLALERGQVTADTRGRVYDLLTLPAVHRTFVARGTLLEVVDHRHATAGAVPFDGVQATLLAADAQGRLLTNDGPVVVRYGVASLQAPVTAAAPKDDAAQPGPSPQTLFSTRQTTAPGFTQQYPLSSLIVASDGTVWATAGASLFRWRDGMKKPEEFSFFVNPDRFPSQSEWLARVLETNDHRILVVASNEGHLVYRGIALTGGVLEWTGAGFRRRALAAGVDWFLQSYTPLDAHTAIIGTGSQFVRDRDGVLASFTSLHDPTYAALERQLPHMWLGSRGAELPGGVWLFGTASGLAGYAQGRWFDPDRLNWMLPEDYRFASNYGVRDVHAVATDAAGRIYAGTDRGLVIYDAGGGDAISFLMSNGQDGLAVGSLEQAKLDAQRQVWLQSIAKQQPASPLAGRIQQYQAAQAALQQARTALDDAARPHFRNVTAVDDKAAPSSASLPVAPALLDQLRSQVSQKQQLLDQVLLAVEQESPGLHQLLDLQPLDLAAMQSSIPPDAAFVEYLPTSTRLFIEVVTRSSRVVREVDDAGEPQLTTRATAAVTALGLQHDPAADADLRSALSWLYAKLLRPVEPDLAGESSVYLVLPEDSLRMLPFGALLRAVAPQPEYAAQRFTFAYMPSLYLWQLAARQAVRQAGGANAPALFLANPDGSLAGAQQEAEASAKILADPPNFVKVGAAASYAALQSLAAQARILDLSTHGVLNPAAPADSYILLADRRLTPVDIMTLPLQHTTLAVLSACHTAQGSQGMEYATLARAFVQAGVPSVVATLWSVPDAPTATLIEAFYRATAAGQDHAAALTAAQRQLIAQHLPPGAWAGFELLGSQ